MRSLKRLMQQHASLLLLFSIVLVKGTPRKIAWKMLLFSLVSIGFHFTEEKLQPHEDVTPYIQARIPFWLTNCWRLRFSLLSVGAGTSAAKPETCLSLYFMPSLPHSCTAARALKLTRCRKKSLYAWWKCKRRSEMHRGQWDSCTWTLRAWEMQQKGQAQNLF